MNAPLATARLVRPGYVRAVTSMGQRYEALLEEDLGQALDKIERLKASLRKSQTSVAGMTARLNRQQAQLEQAQAEASPNAARKIRRLTRMVARLRETIAAMPHAAPSVDETRATVGALTLDLKTRSLVVGDRDATLSPGETQMLRYLFARPGAVASSEELIAWMGGEHSRDSIRGFVRRIRVKLIGLGAEGYLHSRGSCRWGGYWIAAPKEQS